MHKIQGQFPKNYNFFQLCSLVNFFGNKDKPGIDSRTENQQCRWWYTSFLLLFPWYFPYASTLGEQRGVCACVCVCLSVSLLKAMNHTWFKNAWNFPNRLYFVTHCSGLMRSVHYGPPTAVGGARMHVFRVYK